MLYSSDNSPVTAMVIKDLDQSGQSFNDDIIFYKIFNTTWHQTFIGYNYKVTNERIKAFETRPKLKSLT